VRTAAPAAVNVTGLSGVPAALYNAAPVAPSFLTLQIICFLDAFAGKTTGFIPNFLLV
jgi:hypothetical protein